MKINPSRDFRFSQMHTPIYGEYSHQWTVNLTVLSRVLSLNRENNLELGGVNYDTVKYMSSIDQCEISNLCYSESFEIDIGS